MERLKEKEYVVKPRIPIPQDKIVEFCQRNHIRKLSLFGSVLHEYFRPDSDIDVLVEFEPGHVPGLALIRMQDELSGIFGGRAVDLVTPKFLNHRIRQRVESEAQVQYVQR
jgi:predicted nucleotidyltransferase